MFEENLSASVGTYLQTKWRRISGDSNFKTTKLNVPSTTFFLTCLNMLEQSPLDISEGPSLHDAMGIGFWRHNAPWDWKNKLS